MLAAGRRGPSVRPHVDLMKISFRVSRKEYEEMLWLVRSGAYSSISELVRHAVERLIYEYSVKQARR